MRGELPDAVADVRRCVVDEPCAPGVAAVVLDRLDPAERERGAAAGLSGRDAAALVLGGFVLEMQLQLVVQLGLDRAAAQERADPKEEVAEHYGRSSTSLTREASRRHSPAAASSRFRPAAVSS